MNTLTGHTESGMIIPDPGHAFKKILPEKLKKDI